MTALILHGNAWGMITGRDGYGYPTGVEWIPPDMVTVVDDEQQPWNPLRTRVYLYGRLVQNWRDELFHIRAFTVPGRTEGISPLRAFAMTVLSGLEAERFGTDWFASGGFPPGTFQNNELEIDQAAAADIRESLTSSIRNHQPLVFGRDWDYKPVVVPPGEAQFIETLQMNATQLAAVYGLPPDRVGGRRGDSLTYNCVDASTEILTTRGWLAYDQVREGDTALTLNTKTGLAEWQPVTSVHIFEDGPYPVIKMESGTHSSVSTPNHRWPVMLSGRPGYNGWVWRTTETLPWDARICAAAPVAAPTEPKWSDTLVELMAWFWTEGWLGPHGQVTITQSFRVHPEYAARIRAALTELFGPDAKISGRSLRGSRGRQKRDLVRAELERDPAGSDRGIARLLNVDRRTVARVRNGKVDAPGWTEDRDLVSGISHFRLNVQAGALLTEHAPKKVVGVEFLSQLTKAQLELFYQTSIDADGTRGSDGREQLGQVDPERLAAFQVACLLTGRSAVMPQEPNSRGQYYLSIQRTPWRKPKGHPEYVSEGTEPLVWCVQTPNKSWFARRNGTVFATGNTVEQSTLQVIEALRPWMVRLETAFFDLLPANRYVRFNADALLKTDLKTRTEIYMQQRAMGLLTIDEIRDQEDKAPYPNSAGDEKIPLEVMVAMSRSIRGIPKSMLPGIELEVDLIADRLQKLKDEGLTQPDTGPNVQNPDQMLGAALGNTRSSSADVRTAAGALALFKALREAGFDVSVANQVLRTAIEEAGETKAHVKKESPEPEFVGPWIPSDEDLARIAAASGNGNGRHR